VRVRFEEFEFDANLFELRRHGVRVPVERQVFDVLRYLIAHRDRVVPKEELLDEVWGDRFVSESALTSRVKAARRAVGDDGGAQRIIETIRGRGYRFVLPVVDAQPCSDEVGSPNGDHDGREEGGSSGRVAPSGTVTFLFTAVENSAWLWERHPIDMHRAMQCHASTMTAVFATHGGFASSSSGDSFAVAFKSVRRAVEASVAAQRALASQRWPATCEIRVRMGLHVGEAQEPNSDDFGPIVDKAARITVGGHGGQILASSAVAAVYEGPDLVDLGEYRLKDLGAREHLFQIGGGAFPALQTLEAVRHNLPVERTQLFGREEEIEQIAEMVGANRLVTLLGIGGTGKTRLASAIAADRADGFADGVWFVDLVPASSIGEAAEAVASATGLRLNGPDLVGSLCELIADRRMLVVLDNCEHITNEVADLVDVLLERTTEPRWLATSREPLQLSDERQVHVLPLAVALDLAAPAVQLFVAAAERVGAVVTATDVPLVAEMCSNLDGLPLSIELAAAQLRHLSLDELSMRLDRRFEILARGGGGRKRRQASLEGVLQDTWEMLGPHEQELLLTLAAFPSAFTVDDVEGICSGRSVGAPTHTLAGLVDRSVISHVGGSRHRLLETVKLFAREKWADLAEPASHLERHTAWVVDHLARYGVQEWFTSFDVIGWASAHYDDHRAVEDRFAAAGRTTELVALFRSLTIAYTYATGTRASSAIDRIDRYLTRFDLTEREQGLLSLVAASSGLPSRRPDVIADRSHTAVEHLRNDGAPEELASALVVASWMRVFTSVDEAIEMLDAARDLAEDAGAPAIANAAIAYRAGYLALAGRIDDAVGLLVELRARLEGGVFDYAWSLHHLFNLAVHVVREPAVARQMGDELGHAIPNMAWDRGIGWGLPLCNCLAIAACGDVDETRRNVAATESLARLASDDDGLPDLLLAPAALAWRLGQTARARRWLTAVRRSAKPTANFQLSIMFRQLRDEIGLDDVNPLDDAALTDLYREAVNWMDSLTP
jgi:predicted ATPase/DNA-binding winged helix-turn-helix (wHTH) protein